MAIKTRVTKRRTSSAAELAAWAMALETGYDYFSDLEQFDIPNEKKPVPREKLEDAWRRLGAAYLRQRRREDWNFDEPYAQREFGDPEPWP